VHDTNWLDSLLLLESKPTIIIGKKKKKKEGKKKENAEVHRHDAAVSYPGEL